MSQTILLFALLLKPLFKGTLPQKKPVNYLGHLTISQFRQLFTLPY